jgi:hypothetical protein
VNSLSKVTEASSLSKESVQPQNVNTTQTHVSFTKEIIFNLPTVCIPFKAGDRVVKLRALLDSGSQRSFIKKSRLSEIDFVFQQRENIVVHGFGDSKIVDNFDLVEVTITHHGKEFQMRLITTSRLDVTLKPVNLYKVMQQYNEIEQYPLCDYENSDYFYKFVTGDIRVLSDELALIETLFGWSIHGKLSSKEEQIITPSFSASSCECVQTVKRFWEIEYAGLGSKERECENPVIKMFENSIQKTDEDRYRVRIPWKQGGNMACTLESTTRKRLRGVTQRLIKENMLKQYDEIFKEYEMLKIVEKVPDEELNQPCRYIPHHPVIKELPDQQRKIRIVFDASAKSGNEASLNECVEEGPNLFTDLLGILLRFRRHEVGIICDVEKAFLQIELHPDDRDHVRYMWYEDVNQVSQFSVPTIYRLCRVPFGVTSSPFLLNATIRHHLQLKESQYVDTVQVIRRSLYVDDLVLSLPSIPFTQAVIKDSVEIFESMKMRLSKWHTSHPQVLADMDKIHLSKCTKVLGIQWDPQNDQLFLVFPFATKVVRTKRDLASLYMILWDLCHQSSWL